MFSKRILMLAGGCLLAASGAWADDLGYVDCSSHSDETPVFSKARKSPETVGTVACGERFTILLNGFIFSRIETKDGKVGYIYSNYISFDRGATAATIKQPDTGKVVEATSKVAIPADKPVQPRPTTPAPSQPALTQPAPAEQPAPQTVASTTPVVPDTSAKTTAPASSTAPSTNSSATQNSTSAQPPSDALAQTPAPATQPAPTEVTISAPSKETPATSSPSATDAPVPAPSPAPATTSAPVSVPPTEQPAAASPDSPVKTPEPEPAPQPQPAAAQPPAAQPAPPPIRDARVRDSWEKPNPSARKPFAIELFGGFTYTRYVSGGTGSNFTGATGSVAWNFKPWLQIIGDSTYSYATISGTKNALYGNHYGPRYYFRRISRWNITPFVEGLVGGTRADTTVTGTGGYTTSANCISYKVGGGVDMRTSRHIELRLFDVDYYRTAFGSNVQQSNYTVSTGLVLQLFGGDHQ